MEQESPLLVGTVVTLRGLRRITRPFSSSVPDLVELRVDALLEAGGTLDGIEAALRQRTVPVLLTCRSRVEGGRRRWKRGEREAAFARLLPHAEAVDVELASVAELESVLFLARKSGRCVLLSAHAIAKPPTPATLQKWIIALRRHGPDIAKIAARIETLADLQALTAPLLNPSPQLWAVMGLGPHAAFSRQLCTALGSALLYGWLDEPAAPGQPSLSEMSGAS